MDENRIVYQSFSYEMIHELTHTLDIDNGDTTTRRVLGEVAPQCMERMLDNYLLTMTDNELNKYGFNKTILEKDIQDRRLSTFASRFHNTQNLNNRKGNRELDSRYMLAQIYSSHFNNLDKVVKNRIILLSCSISFSIIFYLNLIYNCFVKSRIWCDQI